jgi:DNA invertase Pin-like site-specific DNA recombinase
MEHSNGKTFGYVRISLAEQNPDRQYDMLKARFGLAEEDIFMDAMTGDRSAYLKREGLQQMLRQLRPGDTVVVESLSRLSRSSSDLLNLLSDFQSKNINFVSCKESIDMNTVTGRLVVAILAALAEFERENLRERIREGLQSAKQRGRVGGRPRTDMKAIAKAIRLYEAKSHSVSEIVSVCKVSKSVLYRELKSRANNAPPAADN